jgi:hypothetical protein
MKSDKYYRLTSPANRTELKEFNKFIPLVFNMQKHAAKARESLSFVKGRGKSLICGGVDYGKLFVTNFPAKNPNFRNLYKTSLVIDRHHNKIQFTRHSSKYFPQTQLVLDPSLYHPIKLRSYRFSREFSTEILYAFFHNI